MFKRNLLKSFNISPPLKLYCATRFKLLWNLLLPGDTFPNSIIMLKYTYNEWSVLRLLKVQSRLTKSVCNSFSPSHGLFPSETPAGMPTRNKRFSSRNFSVPLEINNGKNITENTHTSRERVGLNLKHFIYVFYYT